MRLGDLDALKEYMDRPFWEKWEWEFICKSIDNAQPVEIATKLQPNCNNLQQGEWIFVSERLPKEEDYRPCYGLPDGCVMWQTDNGDIGFGWYYDSTKCWSDIYDNPIKAGKVIAWRPLPEPYQKGGTENDQ